MLSSKSSERPWNDIVCHLDLPVIPVVLSHLPALRAVDLGCGAGLWTKELEALGAAWALDYSHDALRFCRDRGITRLIRGSASEIPLEDASFDVITALGVIEHLDDDDAFLRERRAIVACFVSRTLCETAAMNPDHNWQALLTVVSHFRSPYV